MFNGLYRIRTQRRAPAAASLPSVLALLLLLLQVKLVALLAGDGQPHHQRHKLLKVHLPIAIGIQVLHNVVHGSGVFLGLEG